MQAMQALSYNFCNIFINSTFFCSLHVDSWNEIRTGTKTTASVHWCLDFYLMVFFNGLSAAQLWRFGRR